MTRLLSPEKTRTRIRVWLITQDKPLKWLAKELGVSDSHLWRMLKGQRTLLPRWQEAIKRVMAQKEEEP